MSLRRCDSTECLVKMTAWGQFGQRIISWLWKPAGVDDDTELHHLVAGSLSALVEKNGGTQGNLCSLGMCQVDNVQVDVSSPRPTLSFSLGVDGFRGNTTELVAFLNAL